MTLRAWLGRLKSAVPRPRPPPDVQPDTPHWSRVEPIFSGALGLAADQRERFLDRECGADERLRAEVISLLAASDRFGPVDRTVEHVVTALFAKEAAPRGAATARVVSHYELIERLPGGGMGVIYRAHDVRLRRTVALKFLPPALSADDRAKARFLLEARAAAALDHRNVCTIHEVGETDDGHLFIAMPFYQGETLGDRLSRGPLPVIEALATASQIAHGLAHAHERGSVHRDIKPANVMLTVEGVVKILDFGIVKHGEQGLTRTGVTVGTLPYMSPEQLRRDPVDARTDIWSLGVVIHEMLTGCRPFERGDEHALRDAIVFSQPDSLRVWRPELPHELCRLVSVSLAKHPDDRHPSARALAQTLDALHASVVAAAGRATETRGFEVSDLHHEAIDTAQVLPGGERRHATVVVCALSGSAELVERLPPREVEDLLRRLKQDAFEIVERHGGTVNEFGEDRIVLLFGVPASLEDHCARAVRAAIELRSLVRHWRETQAAARGLALHIAIDSGDAAVQRMDGAIVPYRVAGRPVTRAAHLCAHAGTDEILISPDGGRAVAPLFDLRAGNTVSLPNEESAFAPLRVMREAATADRLEQLASAALTAFTGRDPELAALVQACEDSRKGRGRVVTITGEPGLGKSRLLLEFRRTIDADAAVLVGRCSSYGQATAYMPWLDVLWQVLGVEPALRAATSDADAVARVVAIDPALEPYAPFYLHLLSIPTDKYRLSNAAHEDQRRSAFQEAVVAILLALAGRRLAVLLLEDWHWVDPASHAVLMEVADLVSNHQLMMVLTSRTGYGFAASWRDAYLPIVLRPLETSSTATMMKAVLGADDVPSELVARIHERTGGNPFFLEEIAHSLIEAGTIAVEAGRARMADASATLDLPATVQAVIRARLDRLDLSARQVLRAASVVGRDFTRRVVARAMADSSRLELALGTLETAGLIQHTAVLPEHTYRFRHALTQEAAYAGLLEHQRAQLHGVIGAAIEELYPDRGDGLDRLAQHFSLAEKWSKAVQYGLRSAERIQGLSQFVDALQILDRTHEWAELMDPAERVDTLVEIGLRQERICDWLGMRERQGHIVDELVARLRESGDEEKLAEAYLRKGDLYTTLRQFDAANEALEESLRLRRRLRRGEPRTLRSLGFLRWYQGHNAEALSWAHESLRLDREHNNEVAVVGDLHNLAAIYSSGGDHERARQCLEEALERTAAVVTGTEPDFSEMWAIRLNVLHSYGRLLTEGGDLDRALECLGPPAQWSRQRFMPMRAVYFYTAIAQVHLRKGEMAACLDYHRQAIEITRKAHYAPGLALVLRLTAELLVGLGRDQEALPHLEEAAEVFAKLQDRAAEALIWSRLGVAYERVGNYGSARSAWERDRALRKETGDRPGELKALEGMGRVARRHLPASVALRFYEEAIDLAVALGDRAAAARLGNAAGIIEWTRGRHVEALAHFERALTLFTEMGDHAGAGLMMNSVAITLGMLGRRSDARERLEEALAHHRDTGQPHLEGHALAALGDWYGESHDVERAAEWYERSLQTRQSIGDERGEGWMLQRLARARAAAGDHECARTMLTRAQDLSSQCSDEELMHACAELHQQVTS